MLHIQPQTKCKPLLVLCTVIMGDCAVAADLLSLRSCLAWDGVKLGDYFHATTDTQLVRDAVFETIVHKPFTVQATIMEKSKAQKHIRSTKPRFYQYGYFYHFKYGVASQLSQGSKTLVTTASLGTKTERVAFENAVNDVMRQTRQSHNWKADFKPCQADACLQVADYCAWAIQRKWERDDLRSYGLISDRITYEYDLWAHGNKHFY